MGGKRLVSQILFSENPTHPRYIKDQNVNIAHSPVNVHLTVVSAHDILDGPGSFELPPLLSPVTQGVAIPRGSRAFTDPDPDGAGAWSPPCLRSRASVDDGTGLA